MRDISSYKCVVIMPTFNKGEYIEEAILSFINQKTKYPVLLIISDDCSTDNSMNIAEKFREMYPDKIETCYAKKNRGLLKNDLDIHEWATTDYFAVLDPDDYWIDETFLDKAIDFLEKSSDFVCYSSNTIIDNNGEKGLFINVDMEEYITNSIEDYLNGRAIVTHTTGSVYRNSIYKKVIPQIIANSVGTISEASFRGDHDRFVIHLKYGKAYFKNEVVGVYRINHTGIWTSSTKLHQDLLNAQAELDYSEFYDNRYYIQFRNKAKEIWDRIVGEKCQNDGKNNELSGLDLKIYANIEKHMNQLRIDQLDEKINSLIAISNNNERFGRESVWASVFRDTIRGSRWLAPNVPFSPGRYAIGYPCLYLLYRILDEIRPASILELGLGQSTRLIGNYAEYFQNEIAIDHYVVEDDKDWISFWSRKNSVSNTQMVNLKVINSMLDSDLGSVPVNLYQGFTNTFKDCKFDVIFVDAPKGTEYYSRIDIMGIIPTCLNDEWIIIMDDAERVGERRTIQLIETKLSMNNIKYYIGTYRGEKDTIVLASEGLKFVTTM